METLFELTFQDQTLNPQILMPVGLEYNKSVAGERYRAVGKAMGVEGIDAMTAEAAADATIAAVKQLSADVGIAPNLKGILKEEVSSIKGCGERHHHRESLFPHCTFDGYSQVLFTMII